jgi:predicted nucleic acid-binding protein
MGDRAFLDTNILVYAFDRSGPPRQEVASELVGELLDLGLACVSTQVLKELYVVATRLEKLASHSLMRKRAPLSKTSQRSQSSRRPSLWFKMRSTCAAVFGSRSGIRASSLPPNAQVAIVSTPRISSTDRSSMDYWS